MSEAEEIMAEQKIDWYERSVGRRAKTGVTIYERGEIAIGYDLLSEWPKGSAYAMLGYQRSTGHLVIRPVAEPCKEALKVKNRRGVKAVARLCVDTALRDWGLKSDHARNCQAAWRGGMLWVTLPAADEGEAAAAAVVAVNEVNQVNEVPTTPKPDHADFPAEAQGRREDDDLIDLLQVTQIAKCSEPTLYAWMKGKGFPRPSCRKGKKCYWSRRDVAQWLVNRDAQPKPRRGQRRAAPQKAPKICQTCGDMRALGRRTMCRCPSEQNPNRNHSVEPTGTCDWHREPGTYVPVRTDEEE